MRCDARCLLLLLSFATMSPLAAAADDVLRATLASRCELSVPILRDETSACWQLECPAGRAKALGCDLTALHQVAALHASPDDRWLAVISVGEGHPILEIVPLARWLGGEPMHVQCTLNPYPGTVNVERWARSALVVVSDVDLELDANARAASFGPERRYVLDPLDCSLRRDAAP